MLESYVFCKFDIVIVINISEDYFYYYGISFEDCMHLLMSDEELYSPYVYK
jgi:hypothetical protein